MALPEWVVLHIPHDSSLVPSQEREHILLNDAGLSAELLAMTDHWTFDLFGARVPPVQVVRAQYSRLIVDVERFENDEQEPMAACGMGVIYERTSNGKRLREPPSANERERLLSTYYRPHHTRLAAAVDCALAKHGTAVILDCHSFPSKPMPYEQHQRLDRPDICIGTDSFHTPPRLRESLARAFRGKGLSVVFDAPFSGSIVPLAHYRKTRTVASIMVEINRGCYISEISGQRNGGFDSTRQVLQDCVGTAIHDVER
jgi:N-formylglutamate amidohydrolase